MKSHFFIILLLIFACCSGENDTAEESGNSVTSSDDAPDLRFTESVLSSKLSRGYIDSVFINKRGDRIYFIHSIYSASVLLGSTAPGTCSTAQMLPGHVTQPGAEWNTDIYYVEWDGASWSGPVNMGTSINTIGMECCMWLNDNETEIIFYRETDLTGDDISDVGTLETGNYRAARTDRDSPWSTPVPLEGPYGTTDQSGSVYRHDIHKAPSGNYYLWGKDASGDKQLLFGNYNGSGHDAPVLISGTLHEDTQVWASDDETRLIYNHRPGDGITDLYTMDRTDSSSPWNSPRKIPVIGFEDSTGKRIWGEPAFDKTETFMLFIRFDTTDSQCWGSDIMHADGTANTGFSGPVKLN